MDRSGKRFGWKRPFSFMKLKKRRTNISEISPLTAVDYETECKHSTQEPFPVTPEIKERKQVTFQVDESANRSPYMRLLRMAHFSNMVSRSSRWSFDSSLTEDQNEEEQEGWKQFGLDLLGALIAVILVCANCVAFALSVYSSDPELLQNLATGINMTIIGVTVSGFIASLFSKVPWTVAGPDPFCIAFLFLMIQELRTTMRKRLKEGETLFFEEFQINYLIMIVLSTLVNGIGLAVFSLKMLRIADFIPYSVMCGLFTGMGLRLLQMGLLICEFDVDGASPFGCAVSFGIIDAILVHLDIAWGNALLFVLIPLAFLCWIFGLGISMEEASESDWLFKPEDVQLQHFSAWQVIAATGFSSVDFSLILRTCASTMVMMTLFSVLKSSLIFRHSSQFLGTEVKHKREMRVTGLANIASGAFAGFPTCFDLGSTNFVKKIGGSEKAPGFMIAFMMFIIYLAPNTALQYLPKFVFSGKLLSQGFQWVLRWAILPYGSMSRVEYSIIPFISFICWFKGIPTMTIVGALISLVLFIFRLYQVGCIKVQLTGLTFRSGIERDTHAAQYLDQHGDRIQILKLQGFIFFGSAHKMFRKIRRIFHRAPYSEKQPDLDAKTNEAREMYPIPQYLIVDCPHVIGVDTAASQIFVQVFELCKQHKCMLMFSGVPSSVKRLLNRAGLLDGQQQKKKRHYRTITYMDNLDEAVGYAEDRLLRDGHIHARIEDDAETAQFIDFTEGGFMNCLEYMSNYHNFDVTGMEELYQHVRTFDIEKGTHLTFSEDGKADDGGGIYFLELGYIKMERTAHQSPTMKERTQQLKFDRKAVRIKARNFRETRFGPGWIVGCHEMASGEYGLGMYVAETTCRVHFLPSRIYHELKITNPQLAIKLSELIGRMIAHRCDSLKEQLSNMIDTIYCEKYD